MTLTEFLLARLAEDETRAIRLDDMGEMGDWDRVIEDIQVKRSIVERASVAIRGADLWTYERLKTDTRDPLPEWARRDAFNEVLRDLASLYNGHPDYDQGWRA